MVGERMHECIRINLRFSRKGQAMAELAIFGSILLLSVGVLLQYGLRANYQQQVDMEAFRKAQGLAYGRTGPSSQTTLVLVKDKPIPDPRDQFGFAQRSPVVGASSVVWDTNLTGQYVTNFADTPANSDVPLIFFKIDHDLYGNNNNSPEPGIVGYQTARFQKKVCPAQLAVVVPNPARETQNYSGNEYLTTIVSKANIKVMTLGGGLGNITSSTTDPLLFPYYLDASAILHRISMADVDNDGRLEIIIGASNTAPQSYAINELLYMDYGDSFSQRDPQPAGTVAGTVDIDIERMNVISGERVYDYATYNWTVLMPVDRQGLIGDSRQTMEHKGSKIVKSENKGSITSHTDLDTQQVITHNIRFNLDSHGTLSHTAEYNNTTNGLYDWK